MKYFQTVVVIVRDLRDLVIALSIPTEGLLVPSSFQRKKDSLQLPVFLLLTELILCRNKFSYNKGKYDRLQSFVKKEQLQEKFIKLVPFRKKMTKKTNHVHKFITMYQFGQFIESKPILSTVFLSHSSNTERFSRCRKLLMAQFK